MCVCGRGNSHLMWANGYSVGWLKAGVSRCASTLLSIYTTCSNHCWYSYVSICVEVCAYKNLSEYQNDDSFFDSLVATTDKLASWGLKFVASPVHVGGSERTAAWWWESGNSMEEESNLQYSGPSTSDKKRDCEAWTVSYDTDCHPSFK